MTYLTDVSTGFVGWSSTGWIILSPTFIDRGVIDFKNVGLKLRIFSNWLNSLSSVCLLCVLWFVCPSWELITPFWLRFVEIVAVSRLFEYLRELSGGWGELESAVNTSMRSFRGVLSLITHSREMADGNKNKPTVNNTLTLLILCILGG